MSNQEYITEDTEIDLGLGENFEPIGETEVFQTPDSVGIASQVEPVELDELLTQNYDPNSIDDYDFLDPLNPSFRFLSPSEIGTPEGVDPVYAPTEMDPFRQDWSEAEFRPVADYTGEFLEPNQMNIVQDAQNFLSNIELTARSENWSTTQDYLRSLENSNPFAYNQLIEDFNLYSGIWDEYGDTYQFQVALNRSNEAPNVDFDPSAVTEVAVRAAEVFRDQGIIDGSTFAGLISNEEALANWYVNVLSGSSGITGSGSSGITGIETAPVAQTGVDIDGNLLRYTPTDTQQAYAFTFVVDENGDNIPVPAILPGEIVVTDPNTGERWAQNQNGDRRSLNDFPDFFTGDFSEVSPPIENNEIVERSTGRTSDGTIGDLVYHPNDLGQTNAYIVVNGIQVPALTGTQQLISDGSVVDWRIENGNSVRFTVREQMAYPDPWGEVNTNASTSDGGGNLDTISEDIDGDGILDLVNEDLNGNGVLDLGEDLDDDGNLDVAEDLDGDGILDLEIISPGQNDSSEWQEGIRGPDNPGGIYYLANDPTFIRPVVDVQSPDGSGSIAVPALRTGEQLISGEVFRIDPLTGSATFVRSGEYDIGPEDIVDLDPESDTYGQLISRSLGRYAWDEIPLDADGEYDFDFDIGRADQTIANLYLDSEDGTPSILDLNVDLARGFNQIPIFDPELFTIPATPEAMAANPNSPVAYETIFVTDPESGDTFEVKNAYVLKDEVSLSRVQYGSGNIVGYRNGGRNFAVFTGDGTEIDQPSEQWYHDRAESLGFPLRIARFLSKDYNDWDFDFSKNKEIQELFIVGLIDYAEQEGVALDSIIDSGLDQIGSYDDWSEESGEPKPFDIKHFMLGTEDAGVGEWAGLFDDLNGFIEERELGSFLTESQLLNRDRAYGRNNESGGAEGNLARLAFAASIFLRPMQRRIDSIIENLEGNPVASMIGDSSIPSLYVNKHNPVSGFDTPNDIVINFPTIDPPPEPGVNPSGGPLNPDGFETGFSGGSSGVPEFAVGGYIGGIAGGMDDTIPATIDGHQEAALSSGEFVVPADVVSHLGDGNNQNGASKLYGFLDQIRSVKTGSTEQPAPLDDGIMSGIVGEYYGR
tara:strand:- start:7378 stop:10677 length:3300 start_codon:yes stop_codon:yes gene_type:complete